MSATGQPARYETTDSTAAGGASDALPHGIRNAYWFQATSSMSWQMCLSSPLILFVRELGASSFVLGILAGMAPLTSTLQLPMSRRVERIGHRRLMLSGWSARTFLLLPLALLPLLVPALVPPTAAIAVILAIVLVFTTLRGISMVSWMPWMSALVPKTVRGFYLSRDRLYLNVAVLIGLLVSGAILSNHTTLAPYSAVFALGTLAAMVSLFFLNRVPDPPALAAHAAPQAASGQPWAQLLRCEPFRRLVMYSCLVQVATLGNAAFITVFTRERVGLPDGAILWLTAGASFTGMVSLYLLRRRADRHGSKPFMAAALAWWTVAYGLWALLSTGWLGGAAASAAILLLLVSGFFAAAHDLSVTRLLMNIAGAQPFSPQFFALYSVLASLAMGLAPITWGALLDAFRGVQWQIAGLTCDNYTLFFGLNALLICSAFALLARLAEA